MIQKARIVMGGGILLFVVLSNLKAVELSSILPTCAQGTNCGITTNYGEITNNDNFRIGGRGNDININADIGTFINYGDITVINYNSTNQSISFSANGHIGHFINYGTINKSFWIAGGSGIDTFTNYGILQGGISHGVSNTLTINNFGYITGWWLSSGNINNPNQGIVLIENYALMINESPATFNAHNGGYSTSHLVISGNGVRFKDGDSKIILDFGNGFEYGEKYLISKIATNTNGATYSALGVDFSRLIPRIDLFTLTQNGEYFIVNLKTESSTIGNLYKSNIRTMNNFYTMSNSMIYPHKYSAKRNANKRRVIRRVKKTANLFNDSWIASGNALAMTSEADSSLQNDSSAPFASLRENERSEFSWQSINESNKSKWIASSATLPRNDEFWDLESLKSNESFAYKSDSSDYYANNATTNRTNQTTNRRRIITTNSTNPSTNRNPQITQSNDKYYFILTPFVNHNLFFESGRYNLSGLEYGFLTAFSGKITPSNTLGAHFMMSYGSLGDSKDKNFNITNLNLNIGLNYKFDMIWDMYLKARGDFYYFLNQVKTLTIFEAIKPNNLGFGLSVAYGKDFNFGSGGMLGVELGIDYKALQSSNIALQNSADRSVSEIYQKSLYNLIYVDLGLNYAKYFNSSVGLWGLNANIGIKGNVTANKLAKSQVRLNALNRSVDMVLDNDKFLGYANLSGSYVLNAKDFNMEFSLAYYGNYGDRVISNGGGVEWRVVW